MDLQEKAMSLIVNSGEGRSLSFEALKLAREGNYQGAKEKLKEAKQQSLKAHKVQTELITKESSGEDFDLGLLMVHAQDHLMTSILANDLISEMVEMYQKLEEK